MSLVRKLRPDRNITGFLIPFSILPVFGITTLLFGIRPGLIILGVSMWLFSLFYLYVFTRTGSYPQLVITAEGIFFGYIFIVFLPQLGVDSYEEGRFRTIYVSGALFFSLLIIALAATRRLQWRGREIFELAGESVDDVGDGYTSRPRPVGRIEYEPGQIKSFASYCARHLIALPYYSSKNITLVPIKMGDEFGRLLGLSGDYRDASWVNFDTEGEVSVHISQKDYLEYRESLAFDKLCASFGQLFVDFFEMYQKGEGVRIIGQMDDLKIGIFS